MRLLLLLFFIIFYELMDVNLSHILNYTKYNFLRHRDDGPGDALYLTPLIKAKKFEEARTKAKVDSGQLFPKELESYSGYITVNKSDNSNLFFWYVKAEKENETDAPVVIWLQGGPGASSLFGAFVLNGPMQMINETKILKRKYSWHTNNNMIYIDNPVGAGYSFTNTDNGYPRTQMQITLSLYEFIKQFFKLFPNLQNNKFYLTGESYAGKYIPSLANYINKMNKVNNSVQINLSGIAIGNGFTDPVHQVIYSDYLYQLGLFDKNAFIEGKGYEKRIRQLMSKNKYEEAFDVFNEYIGFDDKINSFFKNHTGLTSHYNYLKPEETDRTNDYFINFIQLTEVRKAFHVGNNTFHNYQNINPVQEYLKGDILKSVKNFVENVLNVQPVLIYNGQLDVICAYPMTVDYLSRLKFDGSNEYKNATRNLWIVEKKIAGYVKTAKHLTEILVRNAGHMVGFNQPKWSLDMITKFTHSKSFY